MPVTEEYKEEMRQLKRQALQLEVQEKQVELERETAELRDRHLQIEHYALQRSDQQASANYRREYQFMDAVYGSNVDHCMSMLNNWSQRDPGQPIKITFASPGGSVIAGFALYDFLLELRDRGHHLTTVVRGYAASMASVLLQAGDERVIGPNSYVMIHEVSGASFGNMSELEDTVKLYNRFQDRALDIYTERSTMTKAAIKRKWSRKDWWLDAGEAVKLGFADRIG